MSAPAAAPAAGGLPRAIVGLCGLGIAIGVVAFVGGLATDPATTWRAFHVNHLFFSGIAFGGILIGAILRIVGARWPGSVRDVALSLGAWMPVAFVLMLVGFLGREHVYPWIENPVPIKEAWLNVPRLVVVDVLIYALLTLLGLRILHHAFRPRLEGAADRATGFARTLLARWTAGWQGAEAEAKRAHEKLGTLAVVFCLVYAVGFSIIGFDQVMSLSPMWYSNLFGGYFAWGAFLSAVAATAFCSVLLRRTPTFRDEITKARMHDLGKMIFAFSIFWMYLFWSQYLIIWYGNLPEETFFIQARLGSQFLQDKSGINELHLIQTWDWRLFWERLNEPYVKVSLTAWAFCWVIPFWVLLGQRPKKTPVILGAVALGLAFGLWLERNVLVWPSLVPADTFSWLGPIQIGIAIGFLDAFVLTVLLFQRVAPGLPAPNRS